MFTSISQQLQSNTFGTMKICLRQVVRAKVRRQNRDIFSIFFNMKVCCVFSLEFPHRGDSNEYTQHIIFNVKKYFTLDYSESAAFSKRLENKL